jgi:hypothetical protein
MNPEESSIERLKKRLYSRNEALVPKDKRTQVGGFEANVPQNWGDPNKKFEFSPEAMVQKNNSFFNKFLIYSTIFFLLALGIAMFIFFGGINMISSNNLNVEITAPSSISSGEELDLGLSIINGNRTALEDVSLIVDYPIGAETVGSDQKPVTHEKIDLGTIEKGGTKNYTLRALLFGEKDVIKTFIFKIEYKVKGSNAVFSKEKNYDVIIGSSPVLLNVSYPKEVNSGQDVTLSIDITSNSSVPLKSSLIKIEYPYGFTYKTSNIKPLSDNSVWNIGDLKNGDKKTLTVTGTIVGQNMEDRSFVISAGNQTSPNSPDFDTTLAASTITLGIRKSFFDLEIAPLGGTTSSLGQVIPVVLKWQNTLPDKIVNNRIEVTLSGTALDRTNITTANGGFYQSVDNKIVWDKNTTNTLANFFPGDTGQVSFNIASLQDNVSTRSLRNPHIDLHVVVTGDRSGTDGGSVSSTEDMTIKISSTIGLLAQSFRDVGPFSNTGPIPPKADNESTYTITWTMTNTTNDLKDGKVSTTLPAGVTWKAQTSPGNERITYDTDTRMVTWSVGAVSAGVGFSSSPRTASFQIGIIPSINQIGSPALLTSNINVAATDTYTGKTTGITIPIITTKYSDPNFVSGKEVVVK